MARKLQVGFYKTSRLALKTSTALGANYFMAKVKGGYGVFKKR